jgi:hypothetical protein
MSSFSECKIIMTIDQAIIIMNDEKKLKDKIYFNFYEA